MLRAFPAGGLRRMGQDAPGFGTGMSAQTKQVLTGAVGIGGGAVAGMLLGPRFGANKKIGAMVGAGAGLLGALLVIRFT